MLVTVFTPVYNRAYIITRLYKSLCRQTCKDFEWVVIDDGSTDNIDELIQNFVEEKKIEIRYFKQPNGGKHRAINHGVREARGEMFFIVDSDDYVRNDAVELVKREWSNIKTDLNVAGLGFMKCDLSGVKVGSKLHFDRCVCNAFDLTFKLKNRGDMAEIYKTTVLMEHSFPEFEGERFCPEALVWFRIAEKFNMLWINQCIYVCEYLNDGLTKSIIRLRQTSPKASMLYYSEMVHRATTPVLIKIKHYLNFWRFAIFSKESFLNKIKLIGAWGILFYPIGLLISLKDKYG